MVNLFPNLKCKMFPSCSLPLILVQISACCLDKLSISDYSHRELQSNSSKQIFQRGNSDNLCLSAAVRPQGCVGGPCCLGDWHLPVVSHPHSSWMAPAAAAPPRRCGFRWLLCPERRCQERAATERQRRRPTGEYKYTWRRKELMRNKNVRLHSWPWQINLSFLQSLKAVELE